MHLTTRCPRPHRCSFVLPYRWTQVAKDLYYDMVLGREFEEMCAQMYYRGKMFGFVHLYSGQVLRGAGQLGVKRLRHDKSRGVNPPDRFSIDREQSRLTWIGE
jgi:hypothetical protein